MFVITLGSPKSCDSELSSSSAFFQCVRLIVRGHRPNTNSAAAPQHCCTSKHGSSTGGLSRAGRRQAP